MPTRQPAVAGQFYPATAEECRVHIEACLSAYATSQPLPWARVEGGVVPHAGWPFSGGVAAEVIRSVLGGSPVETLVVFGALHRLISGPPGMVYAAGTWQTPLGEMAIDEDLADSVVSASPIMTADLAVHVREHSIEVQLPFVQYLAPGLKLLPILVSPTAGAQDVGGVVARQARALGRQVAYLGSSDLTHYGPRYGFTPMGVGAGALRWAQEINDRRFLDLVVALESDKLVKESAEHHNACGAGAVAAVVEACRVAGANGARILRHTNSGEVLGDRAGLMSDAVGYAGVLFGRSQSGSN